MFGICYTLVFYLIIGHQQPLKQMREKLKKAIDRHESVCYNKFKSWGKATVEKTDGHK